MLDFMGLAYVSAGLERLVLFLYPTFVVLLSTLLFRARLRWHHLAALLITYSGMAIVFYHEKDLSSAHVKQGALLVLGCSIGYACYLVGGGQLIPRVGAQRFNAYSLLAATAGILLHWLAFGRSLVGLPLPVYGYGFIMATVATVLPTVLLAKGIALIGAGPAAILTTIGPISTILLARALLQEPITGWQSMGSLLVLLGVTIVTVRR
jgi:drug/metabolite transporter (DMT)-like permease